MNLNLPNSEIKYFKQIFDKKQSNYLYNFLVNMPYWKHREIILSYGKKCKENRQTCFFSTYPGYKYFYSGVYNVGETFPPEVLNIKNQVEQLLDNKYQFNFCLLNYYEDGSKNIGMHSDYVDTLQIPVIASVSFGAERFFDIKHKYDTNIEKKRLTLEDGSLLVMSGDTQKYYKHGVPIQKTIKTGRINLTFRIVKIDKINNEINNEIKVIKKITFKKLNGKYVQT